MLLCFSFSFPPNSPKVKSNVYSRPETVEPLLPPLPFLNQCWRFYFIPLFHQQTVKLLCWCLCSISVTLDERPRPHQWTQLRSWRSFSWMYAALLPQGWITGSSALNTFKRLRLTCSGFRCHGDQSFSNVSQHHCIERTRWCGPTWPRELWEGLTLLKCWRVVRLCVKLSWMTKGWTSAAKPQYCQSPESRVQVPVFVFDRVF